MVKKKGKFSSFLYFLYFQSLLYFQTRSGKNEKRRGEYSGCYRRN